ncbi:MAG: DUF2793 domain-containing protein [Pseudomonadota bacterium]
MDQSPRLSLSYIAPNQSQKHVPVNDALRRLDALAQLTVASRTISAQPATPAEGDAYLLPAAPSGADWQTFSEGNIAVYQDGAWSEIIAREGWRAWVSDEDVLVAFDGAAWGVVSGGGGGGGETAEKFGVNSTADASNRLSVKSDAVLFSHDDVTPGSGDAQVKINKQGAGGTASHLFQTGFSGRAELGLTGDDDFHVKVSANGAAWNEAMIIDKDTGNVGVQISPEAKFHVDGGIMAGDQTNATVDSGFLIKRPSDANPRTFAIVENDDELRIGGGAWAAINLWTTTAQPGVVIHSNGGVVVGSPAGGNKGGGTMNAQAVYDDNSLLSCYVFDQALDGSVDAAKWDRKVPDRRVRAVRDDLSGEIIQPKKMITRAHEPMRRFAARIGGDHDPLTLDGYARHWKEKRHLTAMPNEAAFDPEKGLAAGEWIQRLVETVEIQAVLIEALNARVKALEAARDGRPRAT